MTTYNPVQTPTMLDKLKDYYWNNRDLCDAAMYLAVIAGTIATLVGAA